jgi:hypothetical protein
VSLSPRLRRNLGGHQQLIKSDSLEHLGSHSIYNGEGHFSAILRGIDVHDDTVAASCPGSMRDDHCPDRIPLSIVGARSI